MALLSAALFAIVSASVAAVRNPPHILYILIDDLGWADVGFHRPADWFEGSQIPMTPHIDNLVKAGIELNRHYVFQVCSPTRSAIQSGRNPINVNVLNHDYWKANDDDMVAGFPGIPVGMTGLAQLLSGAGYETHFYGKWDAGMARKEQSPMARGYQNALFYWWHQNDFWSYATPQDCDGISIADLWDHNGPAHNISKKAAECTQEKQQGCIYEDELFASRVVDAVVHYDHKKPLFIFWSPHIAHIPYQVPNEYLQKFTHVRNSWRQYYDAMVKFVDDKIGVVTDALDAKGIWDKTLIVWHSDNGGPISDIFPNGVHGANNHPLKGGKGSNWEGGIRSVAFVSGGYLPEKVQGTKLNGLMAAWDWYATFAYLANVDPTDTQAAQYKLPPIDSENLWPYLSGVSSSSPRRELLIGFWSYEFDTLVAGVFWGKFKLIVGDIPQAGWTGEKYPNHTQFNSFQDIVQPCGKHPENGCLYDVENDPGEHNNIALEHAELYNQMIHRVNDVAPTAFSPYRGEVHPLACYHALNTYGGSWGPFIGLPKVQHIPEVKLFGTTVKTVQAADHSVSEHSFRLVAISCMVLGAFSIGLMLFCNNRPKTTS